MQFPVVTTTFTSLAPTHPKSKARCRRPARRRSVDIGVIRRPTEPARDIRTRQDRKIRKSPRSSRCRLHRISTPPSGSLSLSSFETECAPRCWNNYLHSVIWSVAVTVSVAIAYRSAGRAEHVRMATVSGCGTPHHRDFDAALLCRDRGYDRERGKGRYIVHRSSYISIVPHPRGGELSCLASCRTSVLPAAGPELDASNDDLRDSGC